MTAELKFHPLADIFPLMEGEEFNALVADIKANGLQKPIQLYQGMILDGRNRYRACLAAGVPPVLLHDDSWIADPAAHVVSANIHRRHLTAEQKREVIAKVIAAQPDKSDRQIAKQVKADHKTVGAVRRAKESTGEVSPVDKRVGKDGKARRRPARKKTAKARDSRAARREAKQRAEWEAAIAKDKAEAEQLAVDLIKVDRNLAQRLYEHLGEGMWLKDALARGLGLDGNDVDAEASAEVMKARVPEWRDGHNRSQGTIPDVHFFHYDIHKNLDNWHVYFIKGGKRQRLGIAPKKADAQRIAQAHYASIQVVAADDGEWKADHPAASDAAADDGLDIPASLRREPKAVTS